MGAVDECFSEIELSPISEVLRQPAQELVKDPIFRPSLETTMARLKWRVAGRQIGPRCTRTKNPEDPIEDISRIPIGPTALWPGPTPLSTRKTALDRFPLLIGEVHPHL